MMNILGIGLATPGIAIDQAHLLKVAQKYNANSHQQQARLQRLYQGTKISHRHSVLSGDSKTSQEAADSLIRFHEDSGGSGPTTESRMQAYEAYSVELAAQACLDALHHSGTNAKEIQQLVTVSCTGFFAPGLDMMLIEKLGLPNTAERAHIGFMGCHGAVNGLNVAKSLVHQTPGKRVLLCCVELCTLHFQHGLDPQDAVANALFADGAAAVVGESGDTNTQIPTLRACQSFKLNHSSEMMQWHIGNHGFRMRLDPSVPRRVKAEAFDAISPWLKQFDLTPSDIGGWLIHPGGPKVIDAIESVFELDPSHTVASRQVLNRFGNMSSPTVLFIIDRLQKTNTPGPWLMLAFGPGLVIEAALFN